LRMIDRDNGVPQPRAKGTSPAWTFDEAVSA